MRSEHKEPEADLGKDLKKFEKLPTETKESLILQDQAEKSTGQENLDLQKASRAKPR